VLTRFPAQVLPFAADFADTGIDVVDPWAD
jgi:hypothetical protein